jgi:hypothetical protein
MGQMKRAALDGVDLAQCGGLMTRIVLVTAFLASAPAAQQHEHGGAPGKLGTVRFATSCTAAAQPKFDRAVALLHSFDFGRAIDDFNDALAADPACAMAHWGIALSRWSNPFAAGIKPAAQIHLGHEAIERAKGTGTPTERERGYIDATSKLFADSERGTQAARVAGYRDAMAVLSAKYPEDTEAAIFYALALAYAASPEDKTFADQLKAGAILDRLFAAQPDHPGLAHYIIHTYDVPPLANRGLEAARRYARIAPAAPHALHMPSHTFTRVGYWQESVDANVAAAKSARAERATSEELHASDYQTYAYLQMGHDRAAAQVVAALPEMASRFDPQNVSAGAPPAAGFFAMSAIPARYALERAAWAEATTLELRPSPLAWVDAMTWFARAIGAARSGDAAAARSAVDALQRLQARLVTENERYWAEHVEIQRRGASAWTAMAEGRTSEALAEMRSAADREDATEKNAVTPGPLAPARELLGDMLVAMREPAQALAEYEAALKREPNRFRTLHGAGHAAALAGDRASARKYFQQLVKISAQADKPERPEILEARRFLATR